MNSYSQAGQDRFVAAVLRGNVNGRFVDIGCSHPVQWSNTKALEEMGWKGVLADSDLNAINLCREQRTNPAICCDAATCDWKIALDTHQADMLLAPIDYLSCDIDEHTTLALANALKHGLRYRVITVEHDHYQRGDRLRIPNRRILAEHGYEIIASDVHSNGCCFEDWAVHPGLVNMDFALPFRSSGLDWQAVLWKGGVKT